MDPSNNDKLYFNPGSGTNNPIKSNSKKDSTDAKTITAVTRTRSADQKPSPLRRQTNLPDLRLILTAEQRSMRQSPPELNMRQSQSNDSINRTYSSITPYSPPSTPHSSSPGSKSPLELSEERLSQIYFETQEPGLPHNDLPPTKSHSKVPRFLTQNDQTRQPTANESIPIPIPTPVLNLQTLEASPPNGGPRPRSARDLAVAFQEEKNSSIAIPKTPPNADRNRGSTSLGKDEKLPVHTIRKDSNEELVAGKKKERQPTPHRMPNTKEDTVQPIAMTRSAPIISRSLSVQDREHITQRVEELINSRSLLREKDMISAVKYFILENTELLRSQKIAERSSLEELKKDIKPITAEIYVSFMKSPILFDSLTTHLTTALEMIIQELDTCRRAQQVQDSENWPSTQSYMLNLAQKLSVAKGFPTPEALADVMKCLSGTQESLKKTLELTTKAQTTELDPGEDWKKCLKGLRDIIYKFGCFDVSIQEKVGFFREHTKIKFDDRRIREIFDSIMMPLIPCCDYLESFYKKDIMVKIQKLSLVALNDCEAFSTIHENKYQWTQPKEKTRESQDALNRSLSSLNPSATLRTLFTLRSISINGRNLDKHYQAIPQDAFSQKLEGPNIPKVIREYYVTLLYKIYKEGFSNEFGVTENKRQRNAKIRQFAENQLARILDNKLLEIDTPMAQVFRLISTECWARCEAFMREGMPKLFKDPLHMKHATGNSTTCHINIQGHNNFSVTLCRDHEIYPTYPSQDKSFFVVNKEKLICKLKLSWTISPSNDGKSSYKAQLSMSAPEFTPSATSKERWKIRRAMVKFGQAPKSK